MKKSLISVVIAAGPDRKSELLRALKSIKMSSYKLYEIIVVDNSENPKLASMIKKTYPEVRVIHMPHNVGILAMNIGFANAKGEYVVIIDDDCAVRKDTLEQIYLTFRRKPKDVLVLSANIYNPIYKLFTERSKLEQGIINLYSFADGTSVFRKELFLKVGYYDEDFFCWQHGDDLALRILNAGYQIHFAKNILINHYEKKKGLRKQRAFLDMRNAVWFNIKHFSLIFFPLLLMRNLVSFILLPIKQNSLQASLWGFAGYISGWLTFYVPLKKRNVVSFQLQKRFLHYYLFNQFPKNET